MVLGIIFRFIDVPLAICNIIMCYWKHNYKCDLSPVAGESYVEYLICCTFSLIVNAFMPADLEAAFDSSESCCALLSTLSEESTDIGSEIEGAVTNAFEQMVEDDVFQKPKSRMRKCETKKVKKYLEDFYVVFQNPYACPGTRQNSNNGCCCAIKVNEEVIFCF